MFRREEMAIKTGGEERKSEQTCQLYKLGRVRVKKREREGGEKEGEKEGKRDYNLEYNSYFK